MPTTEKKRVLLLIPNLDFGGAQTSFARLSELLDTFCDVLLVVFNKDNMAPLPLKGRLEELKVYGASSYAGKITSFIKRVRMLRRIKKQFNPDVSISFLEGADYVNALSSTGEKIFFYIHGSKAFDRNISGVLGWIRKKILIPFFYAKADKILVVNDRIRVELIEHFRLSKTSYAVMPNFYDITALNVLAEQPVSAALEAIFSHHPTICISGRIAPEKGIDRFIKILPQAIRASGPFKLVIVGDGASKQQVIESCEQQQLRFAELGSGDPVAQDVTVLFTGYDTNPYRFMKRCTMLALPSLNEGMPNTIVEAMCLGVPVIAADCPYGPRELLGGESGGGKWPEFSLYGILAPVLQHGHESEHGPWVEGISKLIHDSALRQRYADAGRERSQFFSKENNMAAWRSLVGVAK